jgi:hypothetical protein
MPDDVLWINDLLCLIYAEHGDDDDLWQVCAINNVKMVMMMIDD